MNSIVRMAVNTLGVAIALGVGYGISFLQSTWSSVPLAADSHAQTAHPATAPSERKILYYRNPMGLPDTSTVPKKDSMGMDYIPVYADDKPDDSGAIVVSPARIQTLGVKTAEVKLLAIEAPVRTSGRVEVNERTLVVVAPRVEGWIERLHVNAVGDPVTKGQPLFTAYSPELQSTGNEVRIAESLARQSMAHDAVASESAQRLSEATYARLRNLEVAGQVGERHVFDAPLSGVVLEKSAVQGQRFMAGEELFRIADLSRVWVITDVYEQDLARVQHGQTAEVTFEAYPGRSFAARVDYLYPTLDVATRTTRVRLELDNPEGLVRPGMFAQVSLATGDASPKVAVPTSAIIDDGERRVVLLAVGEGRFKPQAVKLGQRGRDMVEVIEGIEVGESVVISANFLIDSESQLKAALSNLVEPGASEVPPTDAIRYDAQGTLDAVDVDTGSVTMTHGEIPDLQWPAMTMDFMIADLALVNGIPPGSPVRFRFEAGQPGEYIITEMTLVVGAAATPAVAVDDHKEH